MKTFKLAAIAAGLLSVTVLTTGCLVAPVIPPVGIVYSDLKAPLDYDQEESAVGTKAGTAQTESVLGLVAWGDASIQTAAANGNIATLTGADYEYFNILGVYQRYRTIARGE